MRARLGCGLFVSLTTLSCVGQLPPKAVCPTRLALPTTGPAAKVSVASLVMTGFDIGPECSGTIVHLDDTSAYVLTARHCLIETSGAPRLPAKRARVYVPEQDSDGSYWEPRIVQRVVYPEGDATMTSWHDAAFSDRDWAVLVLAREPWMQAVELADHPPDAGTEVALVTLREMAAEMRPCPHVRTFRWGELTELMVGGYSGAAIIADGRVVAAFVGGETRGRWVFNHVVALSFTPAGVIGRPWGVAPVASPIPRTN